MAVLRKDRRAKHRRLKQLPDAGMVGELVVLTGSEELPAGVALPLPREGVLGSLRTCDVTVPVTGVASRHLDFTFEDGLGLLIFPRTHATALVDGQEITSRTRSKDYPMHHGSRLTVGDAVLRLRLFVGLETGRICRISIIRFPPHGWTRRDNTSPFKWPERALIHRRAFPGRIPCRRLQSACLWKSTL